MELTSNYQLPVLRARRLIKQYALVPNATCDPEAAGMGRPNFSFFQRQKAKRGNSQGLSARREDGAGVVGDYKREHKTQAP